MFAIKSAVHRPIEKFEKFGTFDDMKKN